MPTGRAPCHCVVCQDLGEPDARTLASIEVIRRHGWQVTMIPADDKGPGWAYTIGLWHSHRMPELAMFGLGAPAMHTVLNDLGRLAVAGLPVAADQRRDDVASVPVVLKSVDHRWYQAFFGGAIGYYRKPPFPFLQVVWPNRDGAFPWQPGGEDLLAGQPRLDLRPDEHPVGVWTQDL